MVLANGTAVTASADSHPDLFWAMRGAGHQNFGVATSITYAAFPVKPAVPSYNVTFDVTGGDYEAAAAALALWRSSYVDAPGKEGLVIQPFFSATMGDASSRQMALLAVAWEGGMEKLAEAMAPLAALGDSHAGAMVSNPSGVAALEVGAWGAACFLLVWFERRWMCEGKAQGQERGRAHAWGVSASHRPPACSTRRSAAAAPWPVPPWTFRKP